MDTAYDGFLFRGGSWTPASENKNTLFEKK